MMVITTNHLDKLDPALTRPGRVDTCLHFRKCAPAAILDIFYNFYGPDSLPEDRFDTSKHFGTEDILCMFSGAR